MTDREQQPPADCSRREACRAAVRWLALAGIVGGGAALSLRPGARADGSCRRAFVCGDCAAIETCRLPQATAAREKAQKG